MTLLKNRRGKILLEKQLIRNFKILTVHVRSRKPLLDLGVKQLLIRISVRQRSRKHRSHVISLGVLLLVDVGDGHILLKSEHGFHLH